MKIAENGRCINSTEAMLVIQLHDFKWDARAPYPTVRTLAERMGLRMSRTESFLHYAEENPDEVLAAVDDKTDALIRELEAQHREARRSLRRPPPRPPQYTPEQLAEVPF
ncbi:MAG: hypothetical protein WBY94_30150 [Polyangiaceae bacterium]